MIERTYVYLANGTDRNPFAISVDVPSSPARTPVFLIPQRRMHLTCSPFPERIGTEQLSLDTPCGYLGASCTADTVRATAACFLRSEKISAGPCPGGAVSGRPTSPGPREDR